MTEKLTPKEAAAKWGMSPAELAWRQRQHRVTGSAFKDDPRAKQPQAPQAKQPERELSAHDVFDWLEKMGTTELPEE